MHNVVLYRAFFYCTILGASRETALTIALLGLDDRLILGAGRVSARRLVDGGSVACVMEDTGGPVVSTHRGRCSTSQGDVFWGGAE